MDYEVQQMTRKEKFDLGVQDPGFGQVMYKVVRVSSGRIVDYLIPDKNFAQEIAETFQAEEDYDID